MAFVCELIIECARTKGGTFFHPRIKAAVLKKNGQPIRIAGCASDYFVAPTGVIIITRNPFLQAQLFSDFLLENAALISYGDYKDFTQREKDFIDELKKSQQEAAQFYKASRVMENKVNRVKAKNKRSAALMRLNKLFAETVKKVNAWYISTRYVERS